MYFSNYPSHMLLVLTSPCQDWPNAHLWPILRKTNTQEARSKEHMETPLSCSQGWDAIARQWARWGWKTGEAVPAVDSQDLKIVWEMVQERGERVATSMGVFGAACSPGANVLAVWYRAVRVIWVLKMLNEASQSPVGEPGRQFQFPASWRNILPGGKPNDAVFKAAAKIPLVWESMEPGERNLRFDLDDLIQQIQDETQKQREN
jgi:hypothetical protein